MSGDPSKVEGKAKWIPPNAGKGRKKGVPNKVTGQLREMILGALDDAGGQQYLLDRARVEPKAFMALLAKVLPTQISGDPQNPLLIGRVEDMTDEQILAKLQGKC